MIVAIFIVGAITGAIWWLARLGARNTPSWWLRDFFFKWSFYISIFVTMAARRHDLAERLLVSGLITLALMVVIALPATVIYYRRVVRKQSHLYPEKSQPSSHIVSQKPRSLNTSTKRAAFIVMCVGAVLICISLVLIGENEYRTLECFFKGMILEKCSYGRYYSSTFGVLMLIGGLLFSYLYDPITARIISWVKGRPEH